MAKVYEFLADGFEEIEALAPVDVLRRGGVETVTVSIMGRREVVSAHGVTVVADLMIEEAGDFSDADMLLLPGGMPGSTNLRDHQGVIAALQRQAQAGKRVGAICAAPLALAHAGLLHGRCRRQHRRRCRRCDCATAGGKQQAREQRPPAIHSHRPG